MSGGVQKAVKLIAEPRGINVAQTILYGIAAAAGLFAAFGALSPTFTSSTVGPWIIVIVGCFLGGGGTIGTVAVVTGMWWLERIALIITGAGWAMLLPPAFYYAFTTHNSAIWLVIALLGGILCDAYKRYRRIDWAYLDPTR